MLKAKDLRRIQVLDTISGGFIDVQFGQIEEGDVFRYLDSEGSVVPDANTGALSYTATSNPNIQVTSNLHDKQPG